MARCTRCGRDASWLEVDLATGACGDCRKEGAQRATLGCGTLILIGLVVAFFTSSQFDDIEDQLRSVRTELDTLRRELRQQTSEIQRLQELLAAPTAPAAGP